MTNTEERQKAMKNREIMEQLKHEAYAAIERLAKFADETGTDFYMTFPTTTSNGSTDGMTYYPKGTPNWDGSDCSTDATELLPTGRWVSSSDSC